MNENFRDINLLGPLLFILYMNDFSRASNQLFSILFADKTKIFQEVLNIIHS